MNIIYTLNDKFVPQVAAGITSICENNEDSKEINFYLMSMGITKSNKKKLQKYINKYHRKIIFIELDDLKKYFDFDFDTNGWNPIVLARLLLDKLLPNNLEKVLYLDGDTIVRGSLKELWNTNLKNNAIAASIEPTIDKKRKENLGLKNCPYYNAGVLLINLKKWRKDKTGEEIIAFYQKKQWKVIC